MSLVAEPALGVLSAFTVYGIMTLNALTSVLRAALLTAILCLSLAPTAGAQGMPAGFRDEFLRQFSGSMNKFITLARAMPEEKFAWSPGEGVMPVARVYAHVARYNYLYPSENLGVPTPAGVSLATMEQITDKDEIVALLERSNDHVKQLVQRATDAQMQQQTRLYGRDVQQWAVLFQLLAHMNEHLGQSVAYARMNDIVPPWSR